jgi:predicted DNA-binding mobile mystery protein A
MATERSKAMQKEYRVIARHDLDGYLKIYQSSRIRREKWGWLRGVRQALGMRVAEVAAQMKVGKSEVFRLEMAEVRDTITLKKLRAVAKAMRCEVVYAVVPVRGTLEEIAEELEEERARKRRRALGKRKKFEDGDPYGLVKTVKHMLTLTDWHMGRRGDS